MVEPSHSASLPSDQPEVQHCALINLLHHVGRMLETNSYVRCLTVDFSKAFDIVNRNILLHKLYALDRPDAIHAWLVSFLIGRVQRCVTNGACSSVLCVTRGIIQGSGVGPTFYIVMKSDLRTLSPINILSKYADDINLIVPQYCDVDLATVFDNIQHRAMCNKLTINVAWAESYLRAKFHLNPSNRLATMHQRHCPYHLKTKGLIIRRFSAKFCTAFYMNCIFKLLVQLTFYLG